MVKIYTKTGDQGITGLYDGSRVLKREPIFDVLGTIDEMSSHIGLLRFYIKNDDYKIILTLIQQNLIHVCSVIATPNPREGLVLHDVTKAEVLEQHIDEMTKKLEPLTQRIIVGGRTLEESQAHVCRAVARRAEREFLKSEIQHEDIQKYLNRLSDFFFTLARLCAKL